MSIRKFNTYIILLSLAFTGCATTEVDNTPEYKDLCRAGQWEALGYNYGTASEGAKPLSVYWNICPGFGHSVDHKAFNKGKKAGLKAFCRVENAYAYGLRNDSRDNVCKSVDLHGYWEYYEAGQEVTSLTKRLASLKAQNEQLNRARSRLIKAPKLKGEYNETDLKEELIQIERVKADIKLLTEELEAERKDLIASYK